MLNSSGEHKIKQNLSECKLCSSKFYWLSFQFTTTEKNQISTSSDLNLTDKSNVSKLDDIASDLK